MTGISLQLVAMTYMALFLVIDTTVANKKIPQTGSQKSAAKGAILMICKYINSTPVALADTRIDLSGFGWALGWNSIQYLLNRYGLRPHLSLDSNSDTL